MFYDFKVYDKYYFKQIEEYFILPQIALPDGQFAKVSFHSGGHPIQRAPGAKEPEQKFNVDPETSSSQYD